MSRIRVRKRVRFPHGVWRYVYCKKRWQSLPEVTQKDVAKFISTWGEGSYQFIDSLGKVVTTYNVPPGAMDGYRPIANKKGRPVVPYDDQNETVHCVHCWHKGYEKGRQKANGISPNKSESETGEYEKGFVDGYQFSKDEHNENFEENNKRVSIATSQYNTQLTSEYERGYDDGYRKGRREGFQEGYEEGANDALEYIE